MVATPLDPETGYVRLEAFHSETGREVQSALEKLSSQQMHRLLLDLRGNPGGIVESAVSVAALFLPKDILLLRLVGRTASNTRTFRASKDGPFAHLPIIVLVNASTASAAETLAGILQDHDRALIVGQRTFGKGLVQRGFLLPPSGDVVYLTVARAVIPSGRVIQRPYRNLTAEQYRGYAGQSPDTVDSDSTFRSTAGRVLHGGGGIAPDVALPAPPQMPVWLPAQAEVIESMVDSVAYTLESPGFKRWKSAPAEWRSRLAVPLFALAHDRLGVEPKADSLLTERIAWALAYRATEVRWGTERAYEFGVQTDPEIREATALFGKLEELVKKQ